LVFFKKNLHQKVCLPLIYSNPCLEFEGTQYQVLDLVFKIEPKKTENKTTSLPSSLKLVRFPLSSVQSRFVPIRFRFASPVEGRFGFGLVLVEITRA